MLTTYTKKKKKKKKKKRFVIEQLMSCFFQNLNEKRLETTILNIVRAGPMSLTDAILSGNDRSQ